MTDIVEQLRSEADAHADGDWSDQVIRKHFTDAADEIERLRKWHNELFQSAANKDAENDELHEDVVRLLGEIKCLRVELTKAEQHLGRALGYPKYPADWPSSDEFPYDGDAVCVGDHTVETLAIEAVARITAARAEMSEIIANHEPLWVSDEAKAAGKGPWVCRLCCTTDGSWPCVTRMAADAALAALDIEGGAA